MKIGVVIVDRYVENYAMLARIIRVEANVKHSAVTPKTVDRHWPSSKARSARKAVASLRSSCARWPKMRMKTWSMSSQNKATCSPLIDVQTNEVEGTGSFRRLCELFALPVEPVVHARLDDIKPLSGSGLYRKNKTGRSVAGQAQEMG